MNLVFQDKFEQWERWDAVEIIPDYPDGDFLRFKFTDSQRQIKVLIHRKHFAMFVANMELPEEKAIASSDSGIDLVAEFKRLNYSQQQEFLNSIR